jgi:hypothetical protein
MLHAGLDLSRRRLDYCLYDGTLKLGRDPAIELTIDADSLDTHSRLREKHLRSADFLLRGEPSAGPIRV